MTIKIHTRKRIPKPDPIAARWMDWWTKIYTPDKMMYSHWFKETVRYSFMAGYRMGKKDSSK
jgi:hypothetical protein